MQKFATTRTKIFPNIAAKKIFDLIRDEMALVEAEYERQAGSNIQVINYLGGYLRESGGKRLRPALLLLANAASGGNVSADNVIRLATVMEMLHTATLVHDDIIDNADTRRNKSSVNARFGNQTAVLMGDWLYMSAFETSLQERSLEILDILTGLTRKMTEGELIQLTSIGDVNISKEKYYDILRRKTAYLFSACCEIGAIVAGADKQTQNALRDYGMDLGVVFQIADDLLDITSEKDAIGKEAGADLLEGKVTLPLLMLCDKFPEVKDQLETIMHDGSYGQISRQSLVDQMKEAGIIDEIRQITADLADSARKNLEVLPETEYRFALDVIPTYVIERSS